VLQWETGLIAVVVTLSWVKLLEYLAVFKEMARLLVMIEKMVAKLQYFLVVFIVMLIAFAAGEYIAWGYRSPLQSTMQWSFLYRISEAFGGLSLEQNGGLDLFLGIPYTIIFIVSILLLMLNLIIAILTTAYDEARNASGASYWAKRQYEMIVEWKEQGEDSWAFKLDACLCRCCCDREEEDLLPPGPGDSARPTRESRSMGTRLTEFFNRSKVKFRLWCCLPRPHSEKLFERENLIDAHGSSGSGGAAGKLPLAKSDSHRNRRSSESNGPSEDRARSRWWRSCSCCKKSAAHAPLHAAHAGSDEDDAIELTQPRPVPSS